MRRIREETQDGEELVDYMLRVFRDPGESTKTRGEAASWLADRGFGRPQQTTLRGEAEPAIMRSEISRVELTEELKRRLRALEGGAEQHADEPEPTSIQRSSP